VVFEKGTDCLSGIGNGEAVPGPRQLVAVFDQQCCGFIA
jgi:hypothetical protein